MILDIHGKKIVFGMQWRTLTGSSTPSALAAGIAREVRAARIWHEDNALHMGYLSSADAQAKVKDRLYSAAAAISRVPELVPNALFAFRLGPPGAPPLYLVCGIVKGVRASASTKSCTTRRRWPPSFAISRPAAMVTSSCWAIRRNCYR